MIESIPDPDDTSFDVPEYGRIDFYIDILLAPIWILCGGLLVLYYRWRDTR